MPDLLVTGPPDGGGLADWRRAALALIPSEVLRRGNFDVANQLLSRDHVMHDIPSGRDLHGHRGYHEYMKVLRRAFPDLSIRVDGQDVSLDTITTRYTAAGTFAGSFIDTRPTGARISVSGVLTSRFEGAQIVEEWNDYDREGMRRQMARRGEGARS